MHVGRGTGGFSLATAQKFVTLLLSGGEATLSLLHRATRHGNENCYPLATHSWAAKFPHDAVACTGAIPEWVSRRILSSNDVSTDVRGMLERIWKAGTTSQFCDLIERSGRLAYSFAGLRSVAGAKNTIEFRQAEGTLETPRDLHFVVPWITTATGLVAWAVDADEDECVRAVEDVRASARGGEQRRVRRFFESIGVNTAVAAGLEDRVAMIN